MATCHPVGSATSIHSQTNAQIYAKRASTFILGCRAFKLEPKLLPIGFGIGIVAGLFEKRLGLQRANEAVVNTCSGFLQSISETKFPWPVVVLIDFVHDWFHLEHMTELFATKIGIAGGIITSRALRERFKPVDQVVNKIGDRVVKSFDTFATSARKAFQKNEFSATAVKKYDALVRHLNAASNAPAEEPMPILMMASTSSHRPAHQRSDSDGYSHVAGDSLSQ